MTKPILTHGPERRYAKALFELAEESKVIKEVAADAAALANALEDSAELKAMLASPVVSESAKRDVLVKLATDAKMNTLSVNFLKFVAEKGRSNLLAGMAYWFAQFVAEANGEVAVDVTSAYKLSDSQRKEIEKFVKQQQEGVKSINLSETVDENVLAGLKLRIGSVEFDSTARGKLERLRGALKS